MMKVSDVLTQFAVIKKFVVGNEIL